MTTDATGHGTRDAGHHLRTALRAAAPDTTHPGVPLNPSTTERDTGHGTRDTVPLTARDTPRDIVPSTLRDTLTPDTRDVPRDNQNPAPQYGTRDTGHGTERPVSRKASRGILSRTSHAIFTRWDTRQQKTRDTADAQRVARDIAQRNADVTRDALVREAGKKRKAAVGALGTEAERIAPIPMVLQKAAVWGDRVIGALLPTAPLLVSGYATVQVGRDEPLNMGWMAIFFTLGLEGAVWYLNRLREQFRLEGDGTFSISMVIYGIITLIAGLIGGHAIWTHTGRMPIEIAVAGTQSKVPLSELTPAIAIAVMSAIGTFIWAKKATYKHRNKLRADGQIDPRAPKFSTGAWATSFWETFWSLRHFFKYRITGGAAVVVEDWRSWKATGKPKIWPIPPGFRYTDGSLVQLSIEELRDAAERDTLVAIITGHGTRDTGHHGTRDTTGHHRTPRDTGHGTRDATGHALEQHGTHSGVNGTRDTGHHGTRDTTGHALEQHGTHSGVNGTGAPLAHGTRDGGGTRDTSEDLSDALKYAEHLIVVTEAFPDWAVGAPPSVRRITAAINEYRRSKDGGSYNSNATSAEVQRALVKMRNQPELLDIIKVGQEGPAE